MNESELVEQLLKTAETTARSLGFSIGNDCRSLLESFIKRGVDQLASEGLIGDYRSIAQAEGYLCAIANPAIP